MNIYEILAQFDALPAQRRADAFKQIILNCAATAESEFLMSETDIEKVAEITWRDYRPEQPQREA